MYKRITIQLTLLFILLFSGVCTVKHGISNVYNRACENNQPIRLKYDQILSNPQYFDSKEIEVEGIYKWGSEESAIYKNTYNSHKAQAIWIEFGEKDSLVDASGKVLLATQEEFNKIIGKRILIRGKVDVENKGHLDQYKVAIMNICSIKVYQ